MSLTPRIWIQKAVDIANRGVDPNTSPLIDAESVAEPLLDLVLSELAQEYAGDGKDFLLPRQAKTIVFTNGTGAITSDVLQSCLSSSSLIDSTDARKEYSYCQTIEDFSHTYDKRLGYYHVPSDGVIRVTEPNASYSGSTGLTGSRVLTVACVWAVPADPDTDIGLPGESESDAIAKLARAIQGEAKA